MRLLTDPTVPRPNPYHPFYRFLGSNESWRKFFPEPRKGSPLAVGFDDDPT